MLRTFDLALIAITAMLGLFQTTVAITAILALALS